MDMHMTTSPYRGSGGYPAPGPAPMPQGIPMAAPGGSPYRPPAAAPAAPIAAQPAPMSGQDFIAGAGQPPAMAQPAPPAPTNPNGVGQNSFGLHPDVSHDELANYLLPRFRNVESSGNYKAAQKTPGMTASGAYGYTNGTWGNHEGYPRAMDAPPEVQDARMHSDLVASLGKFGGDPFKAVANHYYPKYADDPSKWNSPPADRYGQPIKGAEPVASYLSKVLPADRVQKYISAATGGSSSGAM